MEGKKDPGALLIIGGAEDKEGESAILSEFVRLAGAGKARICVMTVATDYAREVGLEYRKTFERLGAGEIQVVDVSQRKDALDEKAVEAVEKATGLFFTGGDQLHVTSLLGGTKMHRAILRGHAEGVAVGGTSAGAAMMSNTMIIRGEAGCNPRFGGVDMAPGMDLLPGTMIDTHFSQRGRISRLLTAVAHYPQALGFGIDENTAMLMRGNTCEVIGENSVTVVDASDITYTNLPELEKGGNLTLYGIRVHVLSAGHSFDLEARELIENGSGSRGRGAKTKKQAKAGKAGTHEN